MRPRRRRDRGGRTRRRRPPIAPNAHSLALVAERLRGGQPLERFVAGLAEDRPVRVPGAYLISTPGMTPPALRANLRHNDAVHETVLVVSVVTTDEPRVHPARQAEATGVGDGSHQVVLRYRRLLEQTVELGLPIELQGAGPAGRVPGRAGPAH